ncbi:hypothetical protein GF359_04650 [candidate division WOR-3 bacterium]|uniref:Phosphoesterase n=1 Tax=candidate division WOR-3 bacterium TaxID=2052148 RepID=A0A9D5QCE9_UNCW3|nr:hypothetical protein [candidate division WOR-3 bacterium]MBD3364484.1 hypothetical protein [candidate division WOR-3 bacterium]
MNKSTERVLCFPRELLDRLGSFQGFKPDDGAIVEGFLTSNQARFIDRDSAETDPSWKQLIPYVVLTSKEKILHYVRGKKTGEDRLKSLGSVGVGGHISTTDHTLFKQDLREVFAAGMMREIDEEVEIQSPFTEEIKGLINDDSNPVGMVHLGLLVVCTLEKPRISKREASITSLAFLNLSELRKRIETLETWSQIVVGNWNTIRSDTR